VIKSGENLFFSSTNSYIMDAIVESGPKRNQEWVKNHPNHALSKWFQLYEISRTDSIDACESHAQRLSDIETSCEITARALLEHLGIKFDLLVPQENLPRFLSPDNMGGLEIMKDIENNVTHSTVLITIGENFHDIDHFMVLHNYHLIDSWYRRYSIRERPLDENLIFAFRLMDIHTIIGKVVPKFECNDMKIWYWML
jgi:hypothetical protein